MVRPHNAFLRDLNPDVFARLEGNLTLVSLQHGGRVQWNEIVTQWVYFPISCLLSNIATDRRSESVETSMGGNEGAAGLVEACSSGVSSVDCIVQVDGHAWRSPAAWCKQLTLTEPTFGAAAWRTAELQLIESRQSALCQAKHRVDERFARWIMESFDRSGGRNPLPLTQEFLGLMLGVQRTTITALASKLQSDGLIRHARGSIHILNAKGLEALSCDCRRLAKAQRARLGLTI
jgi:CRP-like cAMP-binding protein